MGLVEKAAYTRMKLGSQYFEVSAGGFYHGKICQCIRKPPPALDPETRCLHEALSVPKMATIIITMYYYYYYYHHYY